MEYDSPTETNIYHNVIVGVTANPVMPNPDAIDQEFAKRANEVLSTVVELARDLIGAHQSAIAIIVQKDWDTVRKFSPFLLNMLPGQSIALRLKALEFMPGCWNTMRLFD